MTASTGSGYTFFVIFFGFFKKPFNWKLERRRKARSPSVRRPASISLIETRFCDQLLSCTHYRRIDCTPNTMKRMNTREGGMRRKEEEGGTGGRKRSELIKRTRWSNGLGEEGEGGDRKLMTHSGAAVILQ